MSHNYIWFGLYLACKDGRVSATRAIGDENTNCEKKRNRDSEKANEGERNRKRKRERQNERPS